MKKIASLRRFIAEHRRYEVIALLFIMMVINQGDRATLSVAGASVAQEVGLNHAEMGWLFSAFAWAYMLLQLPGGLAIDRFGSVKVLGAAIIAWSLFTAAIGSVSLMPLGLAFFAVFTLRFLVGAAEAPCFPANSKIVSMWFPTAERGTATAIFNASQYFAAVVFTPLLAWISTRWGWPWIFYVMGAAGVAMGVVFIWRIKAPVDHATVSAVELDEIRAGGANLQERPASAGQKQSWPETWASARDLLGQRMFLGIYIAQFCISTLTFFFLTWFPVYLVQQRGLSILNAGLLAAVPAIFGFIGGIGGGLVSDWMLRKGMTLTRARKLPIFIGMALSMSMILCNYVQTDVLVVLFMALAFFGKGMGALGWAIISDVSPKRSAGMNGAIFNTFGSVAGIVTPVVIGYMVQSMGSFNGALVYVALNAAGAFFSYLFIVGELRRPDDHEANTDTPLPGAACPPSQRAV
ncbi:MFS transporter [Pseudomonas typographi]|uniref:MFS transporter n=1 Tax=Pseudomonas typographi TaxID=2715964 RepID=A0ABR7Z2S1_9PSED|nr:MFS transporter [Pseudomonas typographi]MBD1554143.1 MFS transporter [Pseudomonas typographi]MBD1589602.1 MFS transporter [Pseudomonas typographi]MBD1599790.1 MFS transporter [Pseudomonas typographi]